MRTITIGMESKASLMGGVGTSISTEVIVDTDDTSEIEEIGYNAAETITHILVGMNRSFEEHAPKPRVPDLENNTSIVAGPIEGSSQCIECQTVYMQMFGAIAQMHGSGCDDCTKELGDE